MKIIILLLSLFTFLSFTPSNVFAVTQSHIPSCSSPDFKPKKLSYKERVALNYLKFKTKFKAKFTLESRIFGILGVIFLLFGTLLLISANRRNTSPQASFDEPKGFVLVIGILSIVVSILLFLVAILASL